MPCNKQGMILCASRAVLWWRILMLAGGFAFGLFADRRPFGETFLGHPIVVFAGSPAWAF